MANRPTRMVVLRTDGFEALLQELWILRPELKDKPTATVHCAAVALIRETKRTLCLENSSFGSVIATPELTEASEFLQEEEGADFSQNVYSEEPHPDSIWRQ